MSRPRVVLRQHAQQGVALLAALVLATLIGVSAFLLLTGSDNTDAARQRRTDEALAEAKAALLGYAIGRPLDAAEVERRLGELPCPDRNDDGIADLSCSDPSSRLGRLPWKTLGLADLRDGDGERLWYAVSDGFKMNPRTSCANPADAGCLNSDATGSITVADARNVVVHDGTKSAPSDPNPNYSGAVAVIIAPGAAITRRDGTAQQRSDAAAMANPVNYLDIAYGQDNADFVDYSVSNGFIGGPVRDADSGAVILNDRIAVLSYQELMPVLERRVAKEVATCLDLYASRSVNLGRYPWAADSSQSATLNRYSDPSGMRAGRIPDGIVASMDPNMRFTSTRTDSGNQMEDSWPGTPCYLGLGMDWWTQWKLYVFYAIAESYQPESTPAPTSCTACLTIFTPTHLAPDGKYVVIVAGKRLAGVNGGQPRALSGELSNPANFLEAENAFSSPSASVFRVDTPGATFNDVTVYK